jgi:three-Cys-motif partner protein
MARRSKKFPSASSEENSVEQYFGGPWTELKLDKVETYLQLYTRALRKKFDLWYIDAFAGSGKRTVLRPRGGIFEGGLFRLESESIPGSAQRALGVSPPFAHFVFIEKKEEYFSELSKLKSKYSDRDIRCVLGDANKELQKLLKENWVRDKTGRAVVFLDPYKMDVDWKTLERLAKSEVIDVWYLFPINAVLRQLAKDFSKVDSKKAESLDRVLGQGWAEELYKTTQVKLTTIFGKRETITSIKRAHKRDVEQWIHARLTKMFAFCSDPLPLLTGRRAHLFSLFLLVSNRGSAAVNLAKKFVDIALK